MQREPVRPRAVLFDLDGTLVDSLTGIGSGIDAVLVQHGYPPADRAVLRGLIGAPLEQIFARFGCDPPAGEATIARCVADYLALASTHVVPGSPLFPGIREVLAGCAGSGLRLALVTTKRAAMAEAVLLSCEIAPYFSAVIGGDSTPAHKPDPAPALAALARLDVRPEDAVVVGDTTLDVRMGVAAGCRSVGVAWGYGDPSDLLAAGAAQIIASPASLAWLLLAEGT